MPGLMFGSPGCCCPPDPVTPCCADVPTTLYLSDGLGEVEMILDGPRPISLSGASDMWWGCAVRSCATARTKIGADCNPTDSTLDVEIVFALWCKGPTEGYRLWIIHDGCGYYDDGINVQTHIRPSPNGCAGPWASQFNQVVAGSLNGLPPSDCSPFVWGPYSQNFPTTYPQHPLRGIYGGTGTWTISE